MKYLYECTNLDLEYLIDNNYGDNHQKKEIFYHYLTSLIRHKTFYGLDNKYGYVHIPTYELEKVFCNSWISRKVKGKLQKGKTEHLLTVVRNDLKRWGVIDVKQKYDKKRKIITKVLYKLNGRYLHNYKKLDLHKFDPKYVLKVIIKGRFDHSELHGIHREVYENQLKVKIDKEKASNWVNWAYSNNHELPPKFKNGKKFQRTMDLKRRNRYIYLIENFDDHWMFISPNCKRTYTNLNGFPSVLRTFTYFDENVNSSTGIDIKNSQPLMLSILMNENREELCELFGETFSEELREFKSLTESGGLYDYLKELYSEKGIDYNNDIFKVQFFSEVFYSKEKKKSKLRTEFNNRFPGIGSYISELKKECHRDLPILLQKKESELMERMWRRLLDEEIPFYPVHDCIQVSNDKCTIDRVQNIILEVFNEIGVNPSIHIN